MVYVILRNGKVIQYNQGGSIIEEDHSYVLRTPTDRYLIARIPIDMVERIEFDRPCKVMKTRVVGGRDY
jgi:hypothetical protein